MDRSQILETIKSVLVVSGLAAKLTPTPIDDQVIAFLLSIITAMQAGQTPTAAQLAEAKRVLGIVA